MMSVTWDGTRPDLACMRCFHVAKDHDHYTASTGCSVCGCPGFAGRFAWLLHLITRRWWA
jgi:hypothetical protein